LYDELQRWEALPNRREPFTVEMLNAMHDGTFGYHDHASLFSCCRDWFGSGMYTGYRRTEFCQDSNRTTAMLDIFGNTKRSVLVTLHGNCEMASTSVERHAWLTPAWPFPKDGCAGAPKRMATMGKFACSPSPMPTIIAGSSLCTASCNVSWRCVVPRTLPHPSLYTGLPLALSICLRP
jgi:hypothetical protein